MFRLFPIIAVLILSNSGSFASQVPSFEFGLFAGHGASFSIQPPTMEMRKKRLPMIGTGDSVKQLLALIAFAEAGPGGYDAVHHTARRLPPGKPSALTLGEIYAWIEATPNQPHAIGRYQFIPVTLKRLASEVGVSEFVVFSPDLQDHFATILLEEAGLSEFRAGALSRENFMDRLALIWAGLPTRDGRSAYHGYAGNRATITRAEFEDHLAEIFSRSQR